MVGIYEYIKCFIHLKKKKQLENNKNKKWKWHGQSEIEFFGCNQITIEFSIDNDTS